MKDLEECLIESITGLLQGFCSINDVLREEEDRIIAQTNKVIQETIRNKGKNEAELDELKNMIRARKKGYIKVTHLDIRGLRFSCDGDGLIIEEKEGS